MKISLKNYTLRYLLIAFLLIMSLWALLFYAYILDEVYDNVDDGLKNQKIEILREVYLQEELLQTREFGINQFRILPAPADKQLSEKNIFTRVFFYMPYDDDEEPYRVLSTIFYARDGKPYSLEIRTSTVEEDDLIYDLGVALVVLYLVLALSVYSINEVVLRKAWKPFKIILANLHSYRFGNKTAVVPLKTNVKEFAILNTEIQDMFSRNESVFAEQKLFIENASHELQTPLAITINKLELLLEDETLTENQMLQIADSKAALFRMVNLNKSLLMLSRIDNKQFTPAKELSFNDLTRSLLEDYEDLIAYKEVAVEIRDSGDFKVLMHTDLAHVLLANLLRNAIKYNKAGGHIQINMRPDTWEICNSGALQPLDKELIFKRFYKGSQQADSNGLGLSIVASVVAGYPLMQVDYRFENEQHVFSLKK